MEGQPEDWSDLAMVLQFLNDTLCIETNSTEGGSSVDEGSQEYSSCVNRAAELILRCRCAEHHGQQKDVKSRNMLIHNIFESKIMNPLPDMLADAIQKGKLTTDISNILNAKKFSEICKNLRITSHENKLVLLFISVLNACREHMYKHEQVFLGKSILSSKFNMILCDSRLDVENLMKRLEESQDFQYINEAKKLNQFRNSVSVSVQNGEEWKARINSAIEANESFESVRMEVYGRIGDNAKKKVEQDFAKKTPGLSNTAQLLHILWTGFFKIRIGKGESEAIAIQVLYFLQAVPQLLLLPLIVEKFSNEHGLPWFKTKQGSLSEYFGSSMCPDMIEKLVNQLRELIVPMISSDSKIQDTASRHDLNSLVISLVFRKISA